MGTEESERQELTTIPDSAKEEPSIDPNILLEPDGRIATGELSVAGVGARTTEQTLNEFKEIAEPAVYPEHTRPFEPGEMEAIADKEGTKAMAVEVKRRAIDTASKAAPLASAEILEEWGQKAADKFLEMRESRVAEKKSRRHAKSARYDYCPRWTR
jgi:hypothetical protein